MVIVPASHPLAPRKSVKFADLVDYEFVSLEKGSSIDTLCVRAAAELGRQLRLRIRVSGFDAIFRMVGARMGVGVVPLEIIQPRLGDTGLVAIPLDGELDPPPAGARGARSRRPAARDAAAARSSSSSSSPPLGGEAR